MVSQPMPGLIRLQWWRDALAAERPPAHPVAEALAPVLCVGARARLEAAIDARERELEEPPPATLAALEQRLEASSGEITRAALTVLGSTDAAGLEVGRRAGLVVGLAELLRTLDLDLRAGRLLLPAAELARHGIPLEPAPAASTSLAPVVATLVERGLTNLRAARAGQRAVPPTALAALFPATLAGDYLRRLRRTGNLSSPALARRPALAPLALLWRRTAGRF